MPRWRGTSNGQPQASIPIGVLIGVVWFKEAMPLPKMLGTVILLIGLVLVSLS